MVGPLRELRPDHSLGVNSFLLKEDPRMRSFHYLILAIICSLGAEAAFGRFQHQDAALIDNDSTLRDSFFHDEVSYDFLLPLQFSWDQNWELGMFRNAYRGRAGSYDAQKFMFEESIQLNTQPQLGEPTFGFISKDFKDKMMRCESGSSGLLYLSQPSALSHTSS
jgi:hypothetical protein